MNKKNQPKIMNGKKVHSKKHFGKEFNCMLVIKKRIFLFQENNVQHKLHKLSVFKKLSLILVSTKINYRKID